MEADRQPGPETERQIAAREGARRATGASPSPSLAGDLERLFATHRDGAYRLALRLTGRPEEAEELVQEALTVAFRRLPEFHGGARFAPWIFGIVRYAHRNRQRKRRELLTEDGVIAADDGAGALAGLVRDERAALIRDAAAAALDAAEQDVVQLRYVEELEIKEIDELLGLTGSGARGVLQRCRRKLRGELERRLEAMGRGTSLLRSDPG